MISSPKRQAPRWLIWIVAVLCCFVNVGLLAEILSTLTTRSNLAQLEMGLLLTFVVFGLPVFALALILLVILLRQQGVTDAGVTDRRALGPLITVCATNVAIPILFFLFFVSVKAFGYYWI